MQLPRHNVPQYLGNAIWDGVARDSFGRLLAAMLGDPFAFVVAPETDALRRLLANPALQPEDLAHEMERAWSVDERYDGASGSRETRTDFFNAISGRRGTGGGLTPSVILNSSAWDALGPPHVKRRLERALLQREPLSAEAAMCGAVHMMDAMFARRGRRAIMNDLPSDPLDIVVGGGQEATQATVFEQLYAATPSVLERHTAYGEVRDDPHNVIYTTPYQYAANGWYGGNLSIAFRPTSDDGSGVDTKWAIYRGCPVPGREASFCLDRRERLNSVAGNGSRVARGDNAVAGNGSRVARGDNATPAALGYKPACDNMPECRNLPESLEGGDNTVTVDMGEMRTPHYKEPREVVGLTSFDWPSRPICGTYPAPGRPMCTEVAPSPDGYGSRIFDFTALIRPSLWAVHTHLPATSSRSRTATDAPPRMAYILAPIVHAHSGAGVFGFTYDGTRDAFAASPPPPLSWGKDHYVREENYVAKDLPRPTARAVPVWGMLYPCSRTNIPAGEYMATAAPNVTAADASGRCAAARALRRHRDESLYEPLYSALYRLRLPAEWELEISRLRVWDASATVDLGATDGAPGATLPHGGARHDVCVLSFATAIHLDGVCSTGTTR